MPGITRPRRGSDPQVCIGVRHVQTSIWTTRRVARSCSDTAWSPSVTPSILPFGAWRSSLSTSTAREPYEVQVGKATSNACGPVAADDHDRHVGLGGVPARHRQSGLRAGRRTPGSRHRHLRPRTHGGAGRSPRRPPSPPAPSTPRSCLDASHRERRLRDRSRSEPTLPERWRDRPAAHRLPDRRGLDSTRRPRALRRCGLRCTGPPHHFAGGTRYPVDEPLTAVWPALAGPADADMVMKSRAHHGWKYRPGVPVMPGSSWVPLAPLASPEGADGW